jgi:hypothetical protein
MPGRATTPRHSFSPASKARRCRKLSAGTAPESTGREVALSWFRGNTHAHTVLCGHADSTPEAVARWYLDHDYHFATLSEHNLFIDPADVALPGDRRQDFVLVPGEELTTPGVHMTALNIDGPIDHEALGPPADVIDCLSQRCRGAGAVPVVNHPNYLWQVSVDDLRPQRHCRLFELYNGHPKVHNDGDADHISTEAMWDILLTEGKVSYAVASDDAHSFAAWGPDQSNPGRGWVMVRADALTPDAVSGALDTGEFYASSGVFLHDVVVDPDEYRVLVDIEATRSEIHREKVAGQRVPPGYPQGLTVEFVGPRGVVLTRSAGPEGSCPRTPEHAYLRARVTWVEPGSESGIGYRAWTQPAFQDSRGSLT